MKAAIVHSFDKPLVIEDIPKPRPGTGEIVVQLETSGLCHSDIHASRGDWPVKPKLPLILGHEGIGIVVEVGKEVTEVSEGDRVAVPVLGYACGICEYCISGWETLCAKRLSVGYFVDGTFAEYVKAHAKFVAKVPHGIDPLDAAPLTCAGLTTYKAVQASGARSSDLVAVFGVGGLGHLAIQYAKIAGAEVVAVDVINEKLKLAKHLGAAHAESDPVEVIKKLGGADAAICVAVSSKAFEQAYQSLRRGGTLVFVALPADNHLQIPIFETVVNSLTIKGSFLGNRVDLAETFELHAAGKTRIERETRRLEQVNEAFEEVDSGKIKARLVFDFR